MLQKITNLSQNKNVTVSTCFLRLNNNGFYGSEYFNNLTSDDVMMVKLKFNNFENKDLFYRGKIKVFIKTSNDENLTFRVRAFTTTTTLVEGNKYNLLGLAESEEYYPLSNKVPLRPGEYNRNNLS